MTLQEAYKVIGVKENDTIEIIKKKYRILARENHPDVSTSIDAEEVTKRLNVAYDIIIKSKKEEQKQTSKEDTSSKEYQKTYDYNKESERLYKMYQDEQFVGATSINKEFIDWLNDNKRIEEISSKLKTTRTNLYTKYVTYIYNAKNKITFIEYVELLLICHNMNKTIEELSKEHKEELTGHITNKETLLEYILERKQINEIAKYIGIDIQELKLDYLYQRVIGNINIVFIEYVKEKYLEYINNKTKYQRR